MADRAILVPLAFALAPLMAPGWRGWRWLTAAGLACLLALALWVRRFIPEAGPDVHGFATAIVLAVVVASALALAAGAAGRAAGLTLQGRGRSRAAVLWTDLLAVAVPPAFLASIGML